VLSRSFRTVALTAALLSWLVAPVGVPSAAARSLATRPPGSLTGRDVITPAVTTRTTPALFLINGARVAVGPRGGVIVSPHQGSGDPVFSLFSCGQAISVPAVALPFIGSGLDPRLFETAALAQAEKDGRLQVQISYHGRLHSLPGVRVTHADHGVAMGYLTSRSAARFGMALSQQFRADHARGSYGSDGLFVGGISIGLRDARATPARPAFPMHTLTIRGANLEGSPDNGDSVVVFNADNCAALPLDEAQNIFVDGTAKYSVPAGRYWAVGEFFTNGALRLSVLPRFTVSHATTVKVDERAASSKITMATPRPAVTQTTTLSLVSTSPRDTAGAFWSGNGTPIWVSPVRSSRARNLRAYTSGQLASPPGKGAPYVYDLSFPAAAGGVIPFQHFTVRQADLATITQHYFQDVQSQGLEAVTGGPVSQVVSGAYGGTFIPFRLPARLVQYVSARPEMLWQTSYFTFADQLAGGQESAFHLLHAGQHATEELNRYPLHPSPDVILVPEDSLPAEFLPNPDLPSAARTGNTLRLVTLPFGDNQPGNVSGTGIGRSWRLVYAIYQNGTKIAGRDLSGSTVFARADLNSKPSAITFVLDASRASSDYRLSAATQDVWRWRSRPDLSATVPAPWSCSLQSPSRRCSVQPMMTLNYRVAGLSLNGETVPGLQAISITAGHIQLASAPGITRTQAQVSYNGGKTWRNAKVERVGKARIRATFTAPRMALVSLRVTTADTAGDSLTETILRAYQTSS
jgi:hypothetical protein